MATGSIYRTWPPPAAIGSDAWRDELGRQYGDAEDVLVVPKLAQSMQRYAWLVVVAVVLLVLSYIVDSFWHEISFVVLIGHLLRDAGIAFGVAFLIAVFVDQALKLEIVTDVARASLGYLLPNEIKGEMAWLTDQHIINTKYHHTYRLDLVGDDVVRLTETIRSDRTNHGLKTEDIPVGMQLDEWFHPAGASQFRTLGYIKNGEETIYSGPGIEPRVSHNGWFIGLEEYITLNPAETASVWVEYVTFRRSNDRETLIVTYPTVSPEVEVQGPPDLDWDISVQHRTQLMPISSNTSRLDGTLLPWQGISLRWWLRESVQ